MPEPVDFEMRSPTLRPVECEFTAPGSETEAVDCWEVATRRRVKDGVTVGLFCSEHARRGDEEIDI